MAAGGVRYSDAPWQFRWLAAMRVPILVFFVIPLSFLRWAWSRVRSCVRSTFESPQRARAAHQASVAQVVRALESWQRGGRKKKLRTSRGTWLTMSTRLASTKSGCHLIPLGHLNRILNADLARGTVSVEPMVTFGELSDFLLPRGHMLRCHVEMEAITVGGVAMSFGLETNSHLTGFFQESVISYEIITPDGVVRTVTAESDPNLFRALPWSYGTLGFLTSVTLRIVKAPRYVHVTYIPTRSDEELQRRLRELSLSNDPPTFLEATVYSKGRAVIQCGRPAEMATSWWKLNRINLWYKPFYYKHVESFLTRRGIRDEFIPIRHFMHRFTRSIFWEIETMIPFANHWLYRLLWGWLGAPEVSLLKLFQGPVIRRAALYAHVVQESIMPLSRLREGLSRFHNWFNIYPLLVFPVRVYDRGEKSGFLRPKPSTLEKNKDFGLFVDVGAYGVPERIRRGGLFDAKATIRAMEKWTRDVGGWNALYTDIFSTEREFRKMFDHSLYDRMRKRYGCEHAYGSVYSKVIPEPGLVDLQAETQAEAKADQKQGESKVSDMNGSWAVVSDSKSVKK